MLTRTLTLLARHVNLLAALFLTANGALMLACGIAPGALLVAFGGSWAACEAFGEGL